MPQTCPETPGRGLRWPGPHSARTAVTGPRTGNARLVASGEGACRCLWELSVEMLSEG